MCHNLPLRMYQVIVTRCGSDVVANEDDVGYIKLPLRSLFLSFSLFFKKIAGPSEQSPSHHQNYSVHIFYVAFIQNKEINFKD